MNRIFVVLIIVVAIAGCTPQPADDALPTLIPTPQAVAPATETPVATVPPTDAPSSRPTLPPTWTPSLEPTATPTVITNTPAPLNTAIPTLAACGTFDVDRDRSAATFTVGTPTQVFWSAVSGAARYRISVIDGFNQEIFFDYSIEPSYTFKPDQFEAGDRYAWKVLPEDSLLRQMCLAVTGDMSPG